MIDPRPLNHYVGQGIILYLISLRDQQLIRFTPMQDSSKDSPTTTPFRARETVQSITSMHHCSRKYRYKPGYLVQNIFTSSCPSPSFPSATPFPSSQRLLPPQPASLP